MTDRKILDRFSVFLDWAAASVALFFVASAVARCKVLIRDPCSVLVDLPAVFAALLFVASAVVRCKVL